MAERERQDPFFRQRFNSCAALAAGWPPNLRPWPTANPRPGRFKRLDAITAASGKAFRAPETHHARIRFDYANYWKRRWKSTCLHKRKLVAYYLHRYAGSGRHTVAGAQAADAR